jgi:hypothetical protein
VGWEKVFLEALITLTGGRTDIVSKIQTKANGDRHKENRWNERLGERGENEKAHKFHSEITAGTDVEEVH